MWKTAHQHILKLVSYEPGKPVEELARGMGLQPEEIIKPVAKGAGCNA